MSSSLSFRNGLIQGALIASLLVLPAGAATPTAEASAKKPPQQTPTAALSLEKAVELALKANFDVRIDRASIAAARDSVVIAHTDFEPTFSATVSTSRNQSPGGFNGTIPLPGTLFDQQTSRISVSQKVSSGAVFSLSGSLDRNQRNNTPSVYNSDTTLSVTQPLLKGAGTASNLAALKRSRLDLLSAELGFKGTVLTVVRDVESAYSNLVYSRSQREMRKFSLDVAQKLADENRTKRDSGIATDLDVLQADVGVANAQRNLLLAEQDVKNSEDTLLALFGHIDAHDIGAVSLPSTMETPEVSFARSYKLALDNFPTHASALVAIDRARVDLASARRNRLPSLSLGGAVGLNNQQATAGSAINELPSRDGYDWQVGLTLTVPWGLAADRARFRQAQSTLDQAEIKLRQIDQSIQVAVRSAIRSVETSRENVRITQLAAELSQKQFDLEKARYEAGLSIFREVQEARDDLDTANVNALQAQVNLRVALADLARLEGSSLDHYGIDLAKN